MDVIHYWLHLNEGEFSGLPMDSMEEKLKSWINHKRSAESAGNTQDGSTCFWNGKTSPRKLSASCKHSVGSQDGHDEGGYIQLTGVVVLNWGSFDPQRTSSSACRHFSLSHWWGGCYSHLVGRGPGCCWTSYNAQDGAQSKESFSHNCQ